MPGYNGSGVYQLRYSFVQDALNGIKILASRQDTQWNDMAGGFNNCLTRDSQGKPTANFDFNSFQGINIAPAVNPTDVPQLQQVASASGGMITGNPFRKNALINGQMRVAQRGTSIGALGGIQSTYTLDRWMVRQTNAASQSFFTRVANVGLLPGSPYALRFQRVAAVTDVTPMTLGQSVETFDTYPLQGKNIVFSFQARAGANFSAAGGLLGVQVIVGTGVDENVQAGYTGAIVLVNSTAALTGAFQRFQFTAVCPPGVSEIGVVFTFTPTGTAGVGDYCEITDCQLEAASAATSYDYQRFGDTLELCLRFFQKSFPLGTQPNGNTGNVGLSVFQAWRAGAVASLIPFTYPKAMRGVPIFFAYNPSTIANQNARDITGALDCNIPVLTNATEKGGYLAITQNAGTALGNIIGTHWTLTAEL
jgi:hypothetical protein